tara:strand:- start:144 stop:626 length:483 start_codon:yes stop_codon:yes gene_type:complete
MKKLLLTMTLAFATLFASAQFMAITTINKVEGTPACDIANLEDCEVYNGNTKPTEEDSWNATDKIGIGYQVNEKIIVGITKDGEDAYELLGRYTIKDGIWATCIYNHKDEESEVEMKDKIDLGIGYSFKLWKELYIEPYYTMPMKDDAEGSFNIGVAYRF